MSDLPLFPTSIITERRRVPNLFPADPISDWRLAIIGEAPGESEEAYGQPFIGRSGDFLTGLLRDCGISKHSCFVGNVCQVRPPGNDIGRFEWTGTEIQNGLQQLTADLQQFDPLCCLLLGNTAIHAAKTLLPVGRKGKTVVWPYPVGAWSGSLFKGVGPFESRKCVGSFHPAGVLRMFGDEGNFFRLKSAIFRAKEEAKSRELVLPSRDLRIITSGDELCHRMDSWPAGLRCSLDIEGGLPREAVNIARLDPAKLRKQGRRPFGWPCVSLSGNPSKGFTIPWGRLSEYDHARCLLSFARLMFRRDVPKILQNQLYDNFVLSFGYGIPIRNVTEDVMIKSWAIFSELPRALGVQASIWTREPHWKDDTMYQSDGDGLFLGCARDSAVTLEICNAQDAALSGRRLQQYHTLRSIQNPFLYMEIRGIKYDKETANRKLKEVNETGFTEEVEGKAVHHPSMQTIREKMAAFAGRDICGAVSLSPKKLAEVLYKENRGYEPQFKKEKGRLTDKLSTDIEALLNLKKKSPDDPFLSDVTLFRHLEGVRGTLETEADRDGRIRCAYSLEAETGRVKCYTSPTGAGTNLQTIQKSLRDVYVADPDYDFFQADLEGADGWTVAAHSARLGDPRMLEDYRAGMKPAKIIALMYWFGREINDLDQASTIFHHKRTFPLVKKSAGDWLYLGCKRVQHGSSYLMGIPTMQLNVLKDSFKESGVPVYMPHSEARRLQEDCLFARYPGIRLWHQWAQGTLVSTGQLESASGHVRVFFGRRFGKDIQDTLKEFLAHEPQNNTTWSTNLAMLRLWNDPGNRVVHVDRSKFTVTTADNNQHYWAGGVKSFSRILPGSLLIEPLHQVHDALCGQWPKFLREWARKKVRSYFQNELVIAGIPITIPFDGTYGPSWGNMPYSIN